MIRQSHLESTVVVRSYLLDSSLAQVRLLQASAKCANYCRSRTKAILLSQTGMFWLFFIQYFFIQWGRGQVESTTGGMLEVSKKLVSYGGWMNEWMDEWIDGMEWNEILIIHPLVVTEWHLQCGVGLEGVSHVVLLPKTRHFVFSLQQCFPSHFLSCFLSFSLFLLSSSVCTVVSISLFSVCLCVCVCCVWWAAFFLLCKCVSTLSPKAAVHVCRTNPQESI